MSRAERAYDLCLHLLPRASREWNAKEMSRVFQQLHAAARQEGFLGLTRLWIVEIAGLLVFAVHARFGETFKEFCWAWRGIRRRGWSAALSVGLLTVAIAANAIVFAVADSLVFHRLTYKDPDRLVEIQNISAPSPSSRMSANLIDAWAQNRDILTGVSGYLEKTIFLQGSGPAELVSAADVTPGMFELLGVLPAWGRSFAKEDALTSGMDVVVISEDLARERFGEARKAVGQRLETTDLPLQVVGVMATTFRFPNGGVKIWRALDPRGELARGFAGLATLARLAPGLTREIANPIVGQRSSTVSAVAGYSRAYAAGLTPFERGAPNETYRRLLMVLVGAAACLLLIGCANVASIELASAISHARTYGVQLALGASRGLLARVALIEGAILLGGAGLLAAGLAGLGTRTVRTYLPRQAAYGALNPIDVDARAIAVMVLITGVCWILASLPAVLYAWRASVVSLVALDGRSQTTSAGGVKLRQMLTVAQIAAAVVLLAGALLYGRTYAAMLRVEKGFNSRALAYVDFTVPPQMTADIPALRNELLARLKDVPGVVDVIDDRPPNGANSPTLLRQFEYDNTVLPNQELLLTQKFVTPSYFRAVGIPLIAGRGFAPGEPDNHAIVDEAFARRFWPNGAVGRTFRFLGLQRLEIVGVAGHVRTEAVRQPGGVPALFLFYTPSPAARSAPIATRAGSRTGPSWSFVQLTIRLSSPERAEQVFRAARAMAPTFEMEGRLVDDVYAEYESDTRLMARIIAAFGLLAFAIAIAGVYGVMAFLVAGRRREIGIRITIGADRGDIANLILGSSMRLTLAGAAVGGAGAIAAARLIQSQLYGIAPTDPITYLVVIALVTAAAVLATLHPLRQAWRMDPAITLRAE